MALCVLPEQCRAAFQVGAGAVGRGFGQNLHVATGRMDGHQAEAQHLAERANPAVAVLRAAAALPFGGLDCQPYLVGAGQAIDALQHQFQAEAEFQLGDDDEVRLTRADADDVAAAVAAFTRGRGVDLCIDHVGPALFAQSIASLSIGGRMVFCGTTTGSETTLSLTDVYHWGRSLIGAGGYMADEFPSMLAAMAAAGRVPVIDSVWSFEELPTALQKMADGDFFGKIVIEI